MGRDFQFALLLILTVSVTLQAAAAFFSFRLMRLARNHGSWILISSALVLMAVRRIITLYAFLNRGGSHSEDLYAETVALLISLLLAVGLFSIVPLMRRLYSRPEVPEESSLGELFEKTTSGVVVYEAVDNGRDFIILNINPAAERIEKTVREHMVGRRLGEAFPGMKEFGLPEVLQRVWKTGWPENFPLHYYQDNRISGWRDTFVYRRPGGELVAVYNDVSTQMRMQEELERRERKFRMLFEQAPLPYQVLDGEERIVEVNPAWLRLTGLERTAAIGRPFSELLSRESRHQFHMCFLELEQTGPITVELDLRRRDGVFLHLDVNALSLRSGTGGIEQVYCMLREKAGTATSPDLKAVVEKQARERAMKMLDGEYRELQRQRLAMLGELTVGMAHEINTPLAAARNAINLMREKLPPSGSHYEFVGIASKNLARIVDMITQMYRFHEPVSLECESVRINALLDNALILMRPMMKTRGIQLRDERVDNLPAVMLPPGAVTLALIHPIRNSIDALPPDGLLTLRTGAAEKGGVFVEIEDNGPGIPPDFLPHLFEPFTTFRHNGSAQQGVGLGMAQVQHTLNVLGGSIQVESRAGAGTCVRIVFPDQINADA